MKRKSADRGVMECQVCGATCERRSAVQKYCASCSATKSRERKARWSRDNARPQSDQQRERARDTEARRRALASQRKGDGSALWSPSACGDDLEWIVRVKVPFTYALSKNAVWSMAGGHVYNRKKSKLARRTVALAVSSALSGAQIQPVDAKLYVDIFVQKPNQRGDAINVIDSVCDGIQDATGIDDRWYCIRALDWEVVKSEPALWVGIGQETREHHRVCSYCGAIQTLDRFGNRKSDARHGKARVCRECSRAVKRKSRNEATP